MTTQHEALIEAIVSTMLAEGDEAFRYGADEAVYKSHGFDDWKVLYRLCKDLEESGHLILRHRYVRGDGSAFTVSTELYNKLKKNGKPLKDPKNPRRLYALEDVEDYHELGRAIVERIEEASTDYDIEWKTYSVYEMYGEKVFAVTAAGAKEAKQKAAEHAYNHWLFDRATESLAQYRAKLAAHVLGEDVVDLTKAFGIRNHARR